MANTKKLGKLSINEEQYNEATAAAGVAPQQAEQLWSELEKRSRKVDMSVFGFILAGLLLLAGGTIGVVAYFDQLGNTGAAFAATGATVFCVFAGEFFGKGKGNRIPAGVFYWLSMLTLYATVYFAERLFSVDFADSSKGQLIAMLAVLLGSFVQSAGSGNSLASIPAWIAGAGTALISVELIHGPWTWGGSWELHGMALIAYGLIANSISFRLDGKTDEDYSFWGYFAGVLSFWIGMSSLNKTPFIWDITLVFGVLSLATSVWFRRNIFAIAGGAAVIGFIGHLASLFSRSPGVLAFALVVGGGAALGVALWYRKNREKVDAWVRSLVPDSFQKN